MRKKVVVIIGTYHKGRVWISVKNSGTGGKIWWIFGYLQPILRVT
jgi:hypothetical protein